MKISMIINAVPAIALVFLSYKLAVTENDKGKEQDSSEVVLNTILKRTSIRSYENKTIEKEKIEKLLRAGMAAPTAMNKQPWHFVVVTDKGQLQKLSEANPYAAMAAKAPLAIVVCGDMNKAAEGNAREFWIQDCSAATENILLAATGMGLGAVWTGTYPSKERCADVAKVLGLPESLIPLNTIVIGYPDADVSPKDKWNTENISYNTYGEE
ncbi:nitroreductase family protein [Prevotella sp. HJM029]|uniref:nitroreductase family protein n=1 Tax=Prevotella sp. HJM029 TaxID=1433844 RepID=UPI00049177F5|nr:nitroreductase family protein [Prevotella sp. HJM029]